MINGLDIRSVEVASVRYTTSQLLALPAAFGEGRTPLWPTSLTVSAVRQLWKNNARTGLAKPDIGWRHAELPSHKGRARKIHLSNHPLLVPLIDSILLFSAGPSSWHWQPRFHRFIFRPCSPQPIQLSIHTRPHARPGLPGGQATFATRRSIIHCLFNIDYIPPYVKFSQRLDFFSASCFAPATHFSRTSKPARSFHVTLFRRFVVLH